MLEQLRDYLTDLFSLGSVTPNPIGINDGLVTYGGSDRHVSEVDYYETIRQARKLRRTNALYKRSLSVILGFVIGDGYEFRFVDEELEKHFQKILGDLDKLIQSMLEELIMTGDVYLASHNTSDGIEFRVIPSFTVKSIETAPGDYTKELKYTQISNTLSSQIWYNWQNKDYTSSPVVFHMTNNENVGETRGFSDFGTAHVWMNRYRELLKDRVLLNLLSKSFVWVATIPERYWKKRQIVYSTPPKSGSVLTVPEGERLDTVSPNLGSKDFKNDREAILQFLSNGVTGLTPLDFGILVHQI